MEKERERNIDVQEKPRLVASHMPPAEEPAHSPDMCPGWELTQWPFGSQAGAHSTEPQQPGLIYKKCVFILTHLNFSHLHP